MESFVSDSLDKLTERNNKIVEIIEILVSFKGSEGTICSREFVEIVKTAKSLLG